MPEKSIILRDYQVQAALDNRLGQVRIPVMPQPHSDAQGNGEEWKDGVIFYYFTSRGDRTKHKKPYQPGDVLWVKETWARMCDGRYIYKSQPSPFETELLNGSKWRSPVHMPREAARIFLRVKDVRVEMVQEISLEDIEREGLYCDPPYTKDHYAYPGGMRLHWIKLWNSLNAKRGYGWDINPWVWVYELERTER